MNIVPEATLSYLWNHQICPLESKRKRYQLNNHTKKALMIEAKVYTK